MHSGVRHSRISPSITGAPPTRPLYNPAYPSDAEEVQYAVFVYTNNMAMIATQYERPSSVKLAGVKHELYHPRLPTLRRMDIDTTAHRLSTEHARTTTTCSRGTFTSVRVILTLFFAYKVQHRKDDSMRGMATTLPLAIDNLYPLA